MSKSISFLVTVHNETHEFVTLINRLIPFLKANENCDLVVLDDYSTNEGTITALKSIAELPFGSLVQHRLDGDFGAHKTYGSRNCNGDYIVQLDADEYLSPFLLENLKEILEANNGVDLFRLPRVNIVRGLTPMDARQWGWSVTNLPPFGDLPIINWTNNGDYQARIYRNDPKIYWHKKLHETITGAETVCTLPLDVDFAIIHDKTIDRQRAQNEFYNRNWSAQANRGQG